MPTGQIKAALAMLPRLQAEEAMTGATQIGVGFGGDKGGKVWRGWQRAARGEGQNAARSQGPFVVPSVSSQAQFFGTMGADLTVLEVESEQAFVEMYRQSERDHAAAVAAGLAENPRKRGA